MTGKIILHETALGLIIGREDAGFQHQDMPALNQQVCRRTGQSKRRKQMPVPVKDSKLVRAGLTDKYPLMERIRLQKGYDPAALHPRNERTCLEETGINLRLSWQGLIRQCVGAMFAIIRDDFSPIFR